MAVPFGKWSGTSGEIAPTLYGRPDFTGYVNGWSTLRNCFVSYRGGAFSRAGTKFVGISRQTIIAEAVPPRLIPFQFSINQGLALEFGAFYMRVISSGAYVTEPTQAITNITNASPGVLTVAAHGYQNNDEVFIDGIVGMTELNGQTLLVENATLNKFSLADIFGNPIDTTLYAPYGGGGTTARIYTLPTPYNDVDLPYLKYTQSADVMSICCVNPFSLREYETRDLSRIADDDWSFAVVTSDPTIVNPQFVTVTASATGSISYQYQVTAVNSADGTESLPSGVAGVSSAVDVASTAGTITVSWSAVVGAESYNIYKATPGFGINPPVGSAFGYAGTALGGQFLDSNVVSDFTQVPPRHQSPFARGVIQQVNPQTSTSGNSIAVVSINTTTGTNGRIEAILDSTGTVTGYLIDDGGRGYAPTDTVTVTGAGASATGSYTATAFNPTVGQSIIINGTAWGFVAGGATGNETNIAANTTDTFVQLAADLNASTDANVILASYVASGSVLDITYKTFGSIGNSFTIGAGTYGGTPSGATLTGGTDDGGVIATAELVVGPESGTYPSTVSYFQERRAYANTLNNPDTYFMSQPGSFTNFDSRIPTIASDAIIGSPWAVQVDGIQWMVPTSGGLLVMTGLSAWLLAGAGSFATNVQPISPSTQDAVPQAFSGCSATVPPIKINYDVIYVESKNSYYYDLPYQLYTLSEPIDITELSTHLFSGRTIVQHAWCEQPNKVLWSVRDDGVMLSLTYYKTQKIQGWARHDTYGLFQSVCSVTEPPVDALYVVVQRFLAAGAIYTIERMDNRIWTSAEDCWCVDCGLSLPQPTPQSSLFANSTTGSGAISGFTNLVGGQNYSAGTTAMIVDIAKKGTGATATPLIVGGAIVGITLTPGQDYADPQINFYDPAGSAGGFGASAQLTLLNAVEFVATSPTFEVTDIGSVLRMGGGIATITQFTDAQHVTGNLTSPIVDTLGGSGQPLPQLPGAWTLTPPTSSLGGLFHLIGDTVTGVADGNVIPPTVVRPDGSIPLPAAVTSAVVGLGFTAQAQSIYLPEPPLQGQRKKVAAVTVRVESSRDLQVGANQIDGSTTSPPSLAPEWTDMTPLPDKGARPYGGTFGPLFTGDSRAILPEGWGTKGQVAIQQVNPLPMNILAMLIEVLPGDTPENKASPPPKKGANNPG